MNKCPECGKDHTKVPAKGKCIKAIREARENPAPAKKVSPAPKKAKKSAAARSLDFEADSPQVEPKSEGELAQLSKLAIKIIAKQDRIADLEENLVKENEELRQMETQDMPALMEQLGLKEFSLADGSKVNIKQIVSASIPSMSAIFKEKDPTNRAAMMARRDKCFKLLKAAGAEALIKTEIWAPLGKDSKALATKALEALTELGITAKSEENVHAQTLQAWVRERLAGGLPVDMDSFAVFDGKKAEIKRPK